MAWTTLTRSTPVPTDRPISVTVRLDPESVTGDRVFPELRRHMAVSTTTIKEIKNARGVVTARDYTAVGVAYRAWRKSELEGSLRHLGIPFDSVVIRHETAAAPSRAASVVRGIRDGIASAIPGGAGANAAVGMAEAAAEDPPPETSKLPIIIGGIAVALGLGVAAWAVFRS